MSRYALVYSNCLTRAPDQYLSLRWYDAQGCFESESIDIEEQLPILAVMLVIFQRFDRRMWGLDSKEVKIGNETFQLEPDSRCRFELIGRRMFGSPAVRVSEKGTPELKDEMPLFFKSSWVKCCDAKEPDTVKLVHERANTLLPEKYRKMVIDHVPTVIASQVCSKGTTSIIRLLVKEADESIRFSEKDVRKHARERVWMVSRKLEPTHGSSPSEFWWVFWEILRCTFRLSLSSTFTFELISGQVTICFGRSVLRTVISVFLISCAQDEMGLSPAF